MRAGGLFDGIGLLAFGLHLAGLEHAWLCEVDPWRREILERRWPGGLMTSGPIQNLNAPCMVCERPAGDHTLREWSACMGTTTTDLPYEDVPADVRALADRFGLPDGTIVADNIVAKSLVARAGVGTLGQRIVLPVVLHEFSRSPRTGDVVARVAYLGDAHTVRQYGRLLRDTANGAANAAERSTA